MLYTRFGQTHSLQGLAAWSLSVPELEFSFKTRPLVWRFRFIIYLKHVNAVSLCLVAVSVCRHLFVCLFHCVSPFLSLSLSLLLSFFMSFFLSVFLSFYLCVLNYLIMPVFRSLFSHLFLSFVFYFVRSFVLSFWVSVMYACLSFVLCVVLSSFLFLPLGLSVFIAFFSTQREVQAGTSFAQEYTSRDLQM